MSTAVLSGFVELTLLTSAWWSLAQHHNLKDILAAPPKGDFV